MGNTLGSASVLPGSAMNMFARSAQIGFDQLTSMLALQAKRIERDRAVTQRALDAVMQVRACDMGAMAQAWQVITREYLAASAGLWEQGLIAYAQNQAAYGALFRDMVVDTEKAWMRGAPAQSAQKSPVAPAAGEWLAYLGRLMGGRPDGEATPAQPDTYPTGTST